eukprot:COSAG01_NODE_18273_length_1087_cov_1.611336_1_plen_76_part_00
MATHSGRLHVLSHDGSGWSLASAADLENAICAYCTDDGVSPAVHGWMIFDGMAWVAAPACFQVRPMERSDESDDE